MSDYKKRDGGPAFPATIQLDYRRMGEIEKLVSESGGGLTKREWFAGMALQMDPDFFDPYERANETPLSIAIRAFKIADAMIAEAEKP